MNSIFNRRIIASFSTVFLTLVCGLDWAYMDVISLYLIWAIQFCYLAVAFTSYDANSLEIKDRRLLNFYFLWVFLSIIRGALYYTLGNYWIWKNWFQGSFVVLLPVLIYIYSQPEFLSQILRTWLKYALLLFLCLLPFINNEAYSFYWGPIYLLMLFWPIFPGRWKVVLLLLLLLMLTANFSARSQVIRGAIVLLLSLGCIFRHLVSNFMLKLFHWFCYLVPLSLLILGLTGIFNVFEGLATNEGKYTEKRIDRHGQVVDEDLSADTRTFIFVEVLSSAIKHDYVLWGRTPARGNDSAVFGQYSAEELKTGLYERHANETGLPTVFTWIGLIGLVLISLIYLRSSWLAVYDSNNRYVKIVGCFVAFRWGYGWIEDTYLFNPLMIGLFMCMGLCMSRYFRKMSDAEMKTWLLGLIK